MNNKHTADITRHVTVTHTMMKDSKSSRALAWTIAALQAPAALWISCEMISNLLDSRSAGGSKMQSSSGFSPSRYMFPRLVAYGGRGNGLLFDKN